IAPGLLVAVLTCSLKVPEPAFSVLVLERRPAFGVRVGRPLRGGILRRPRLRLVGGRDRVVVRFLAMRHDALLSLGPPGLPLLVRGPPGGVIGVAHLVRPLVVLG